MLIVMFSYVHVNTQIPRYPPSTKSSPLMDTLELVLKSQELLWLTWMVMRQDAGKQSGRQAVTVTVKDSLVSVTIKKPTLHSS